MDLWHVRFETIRPLVSLPRASAVCRERQDSADYHHEGRFRSAERQCLFKYTLSGRGVFRDAAGEHALPAGTGFVCKVADPATAYYYPPEATEPWEFVYLTFQGPASHTLVEELLDRYGPIYPLPPAVPPVALLLDYARHDGQTLTRSADETARIVLDLLAGLLQAKAPSSDEATGTLSARARRVARDHLGKPFSVNQWADLLGVTREHLTRSFIRQTGQTPSRYLRGEKMHQACRLLKQTAQPIGEVARAVGYDDPASFARAFKREMRMSPGQFRRVGSVPLR
jgi:AraC family transcriptional regulator, arabinose operon regulatory protein